jgi:hypothetical protein
MFTLRIWVFKFDVLKHLFILSKHGTKANTRGTKMANNRHTYTRDVLQSYWTSDELPLYRKKLTGEKTHTNQQRERLAIIRQTSGNIWSWRQVIVPFGLTDAIRNQSRTQTTLAAQYTSVNKNS